MKDFTRRYLSTAERRTIEEAVRQAEAATSGEIVVMVVSSCDPYRQADLRGGLLLALPLALFLTPLAGGRFWLGPWNLWVFLALGAVLFPLALLVVERISWLRRLLTSGTEMADEVAQAAQAAFFRHGLHRTHQESGVLIFIALFERRVQVLADRGIDARLPAGTWQAVVDRLRHGIAQRQTAKAICTAVTAVGALLAAHFPPRADNPDELGSLILDR